MSAVTARREGRAVFTARGVLALLFGWGAAACQPHGTSAAVVDAGPALPDAWIDCVAVVHVSTDRGYRASNITRFGDADSTLRTTARVGDLGVSDVQSFCDWEACVRTNGYAHTCWVNDAGWERCRVCDGSADCGGDPTSQADCVAHAIDPGRASCHVGLLEECLLQRAIRGPADPRVTRSCAESAQACAGQLPGDLTALALGAQEETAQVTVEEAREELAVAAAEEYPDASYEVTYWQQQLSLWDGGLPPGEQDAGAPDDAGADGD